MTYLSLILMVAAFVLFFLAAFQLVTSSRFSLTDAGLACWVLSTIIGAGGALLK